MTNIFKHEIRIGKPKYFANGTTITCIISVQTNLYTDRYEQFILPFLKRKGWHHPQTKGNYGVFRTRSFVGIAKCSPEDAFDEKKGKRIAYLRAKSKLLFFQNDLCAHVARMYEEECRKLMLNSYAGEYIKNNVELTELIK